MNSASAGSAKVRSSPPNGESSARSRSTVSGARLAITVIHGLAKSSAAEAARRNSGFEASPKHSPAARHTVVVRSTVSPGTTEGLVKTTLEENSGMVANEGFGLASNPEFLRAVSAAEDFANPWMTIIASRDPQNVERLRSVLAPFGGELRTFTNPAEAEFIKAAHNIYNATKISFWNEMWLVAQKIGVNLDPIAATVARSAEGSINPEYGIRGGAPYGGVCLPKDTQGFLGFADTIDVDMPLLTAVVETNDRLATIVQEEVDTATHAASHAQLRQAASGKETAAAVASGQQQHEPA